MSYSDLHEGILELFVEASRRHHEFRSSRVVWIPSSRSGRYAKRVKKSRREVYDVKPAPEPVVLAPVSREYFLCRSCGSRAPLHRCPG